MKRRQPGADEIEVAEVVGQGWDAEQHCDENG